MCTVNLWCWFDLSGSHDRIIFSLTLSIGKRSPTQLTSPLEEDSKLAITDAELSAGLGSPAVNDL